LYTFSDKEAMLKIDWKEHRRKGKAFALVSKLLATAPALHSRQKLYHGNKLQKQLRMAGNPAGCWKCSGFFGKVITAQLRPRG